MSNGRLGTSMSAANNFVTVYTVPAGATFATVSIDVLNSGDTNIDVKLYISTSTTPGVGDLIDLATLTAHGHLIQSCRLLSANEKVIVWANSANAVIRVEGLEEGV